VYQEATRRAWRFAPDKAVLDRRRGGDSGGSGAEAGGLVTLLAQVRDLLRGKGIKDAKITLTDGTEIIADEISAEDVKALQKKP
jgi:hypothetical protein